MFHLLLKMVTIQHLNLDTAVNPVVKPRGRYDEELSPRDLIAGPRKRLYRTCLTGCLAYAERLLKMFLCFILFFYFRVAFGEEAFKTIDHISENPAVELEMLGVRLGSSYAKTKEQLIHQYGLPISSQNAPRLKDVFSLHSTGNKLEIFGRLESGFPVVDIIQVNGNKPIQNFHFFGKINLGKSGDLIPILFPRAEVQVNPETGFHRYAVPFTNYLVGTKDTKVVSIAIQDVHTIFVAGKNGDSISLTENLAFIASQKKLLKHPVEIDTLSSIVENPLKPYCASRYPLRLSLSGHAFIDVVLKDKKSEVLVPATFLVDTGCTYTSISPSLCQKIHCQYLKTASKKVRDTEFIREVSGTFMSLGIGYTEKNTFDIIPPKILVHAKVDGVLGADLLNNMRVFMNFKQGYICLPTLPLSDVAQKLKYKKLKLNIERKYRMHIWIPFYANHQVQTSAILDSGSNLTSLIKPNIAFLQLKNLNFPMLMAFVDGLSTRPLYGPVEIGWPDLGITQRLPVIFEEEKDTEFARLGMDFLRYYVVGLDVDANVVYLGE